MEQNFITVIIPTSHKNRRAIEKHLDDLGNPANGDIRQAFRKNRRVHFMSSALAYSETEQDYLIFEMSVDGSVHEALALFDDKKTGLESLFKPLLMLAGSSRENSSFLRQHMIRTGTGYFKSPGLSFSGTPAMRVPRILQDQKLARGIRDYFDEAAPSGGSLEILTQLREAIKTHDHFTKPRGERAALASLISDEPAPILSGPKRAATDPRVICQILLKTIQTLMWPLLIVAMLATYFTLPEFEQSLLIIWGAMWRFALWSMGLILATALIFLQWLIRREKKEGSDLSLPEKGLLSQSRAREDSAYAQNHLFAVSTMKPGFMRKTVLRLTFLIVGQLAKRSFRPGFLADIGTIHFARWFMIPGTNKLIFCSNYGGSWESYLEDFITKATEGLTGIWSNTVGFPRARLLFFKGASSGEAFKRWARRQQIPTRFWYSAYPDLTTERIRINTAIRHGLISASTETEADDFMSLFASRVRPKNDLERDEIQTLLFKGLGGHGLSACLLLRLPNKPETAKAWLASAQTHIGFGERAPNSRIDQISFSASGLKKLDLNAETLAQFSYPFLQGMSHKDRSRVLADTGDDAPSHWAWGNNAPESDKSVDCAYLVYVPSGAGGVTANKHTLNRYCAAFEETLETSGGQIIDRIVTSHLHERKAKEDEDGYCPYGNPDLPREPFGFVDGISQPIIKGLMRGKPAAQDTIHHVAAGEFILGYPDNRGTQTLEPTLGANLDSEKILPDYRISPENTGSIKMTSDAPDALRAFARNGSYLVIRQLDQDVKRFEDFLTAAADKHKTHQGIPSEYSQWQLKEFLAAKMVGRWKDGTSLVQFPFEPGTGWDGQKQQRPDNEFLLGKEDPTGHLCPFGSHIRRSNPRDSFPPHDRAQLDIVNRHRILRRGRFYSDAKTQKTGLLFMCFNADIERQFEFIQQTWCQAGKFMGLDNEVDAIIGRGQTMGRVTIPTERGPIFLNGLPDIVSVVGGEYFFMPSRSALTYLSR